MIAIEFFVAFIVALILSTLFVLTTEKGIRKKNPIWLFLFIFLITWAGGIWMIPIGPILYGVRWLPFVLVGLIAVLLFVALSHNRLPKDRLETLEMLDRIEQGKEIEQVTYITLSLFFWVLVMGLIAAIVLHYVRG
jgi:hypothetical protein